MSQVSTRCDARNKITTSAPIQQNVRVPHTAKPSLFAGNVEVSERNHKRQVRHGAFGAYAPRRAILVNMEGARFMRDERCRTCTANGHLWKLLIT